MYLYTETKYPLLRPCDTLTVLSHDIWMTFAEFRLGLLTYSLLTIALNEEITLFIYAKKLVSYLDMTLDKIDTVCGSESIEEE